MKNVAKLSERERKELFSETAYAMNITAAAAEKDFWICWALFCVFEDERLSQILRFKGGTSLSKCYNAIERFSEDIDLILDWQHLTAENPTDESRSKTKQGKFNKEINQQAQRYIADSVLPRLTELMGETCDVFIDSKAPHIINVAYPKAFHSEYLRPEVCFEIGPLAAMLPTEMCYVQPYAAIQFPSVFEKAKFAVPTIVLERTFWEKLTILHAEAHRPSDKELPARYARHYYDVYKLVETGLYKKAIEQHSLLADVVEFKKKFYPSAWAHYESATLTGLVLQPSRHYIDVLRKDYRDMQEMLFGDKPSFDSIIETLIKLEDEVHSRR